jgi:hypothetical protein
MVATTEYGFSLNETWKVQTHYSNKAIVFLSRSLSQVIFTSPMMMDELSVGWGVALLQAGHKTGHKTGLMCSTVLSLMSQLLIFCICPGFADETIFVLHVFGFQDSL